MGIVETARLRPPAAGGVFACHWWLAAGIMENPLAATAAMGEHRTASTHSTLSRAQHPTMASLPSPGKLDWNAIRM